MADNTIRPSKAPNLLIAPVEYRQQYQDQLNNALRLYFNQVDNEGYQLIEANYSQLTMQWMGLGGGFFSG
jgi:hypothetical protein